MQAEHISRDRTRKTTLTGILSAIVIITLVLESIAPTGRLGFYVLAAFVISVILLECGVRFAWAGYVVTSLAGFLIVPDKLNIIPYIAFFGIYTLVKYHIERLRIIWVVIILKLAAFNLFLWPAWSIAKTFLPDNFIKGLGVLIAGLILQIMFLLYDYILTAWIHYYFNKIAHRLRKN